VAVIDLPSVGELLRKTLGFEVGDLKSRFSPTISTAQKRSRAEPKPRFQGNRAMSSQIYHLDPAPKPHFGDDPICLGREVEANVAIIVQIAAGRPTMLASSLDADDWLGKGKARKRSR
jgi:hypothetical protein